MHDRIRSSHIAGRIAGLLAVGAVVAACSSDSSSGPAGPQDVTLRFAARVGAQPFTCGNSYSGVGSPASTITPTDFMLYVSDVRLVRGDGTEVPVTLTQGTPWQLDNVALIDFAAGGAGTPCANASPETNVQVTGTAPTGTYTGVRFTLGLPFEKNHGDATTATGPLSVTRMFWSWNAGYKAVRLDVNTNGAPNGWFIHLGSTGCTPTGNASTVPTSCTAPNRPEVTLSGFDPATGVIIADIAQLLANSNVDGNQGGPAGCMSGTTDGDCPAIFASFGLPFAGGSIPASQTFFRAGSN